MGLAADAVNTDVNTAVAIKPVNVRDLVIAPAIVTARAFGRDSMAQMPTVDTTALKVIERLPGWRGRYFHTAAMTFAHYDFVRGCSIHEHFHPEEEVYEVTEGDLELTIDGEIHIARPGLVAIVPANARHSVKALTDGKAIIVDHPARRDFGA